MKNFNAYGLRTCSQVGNLRNEIATLATYFFSAVPHALARTSVRRIKYLLINVFEIQVKLLLVVITASDIAQSSHFTGNVTGTRKGQV